jgi:hypothetical protein
MELSRIWLSAVSTIAVFATFFGLLLLSPEPSVEHAELRCEYPGAPAAVFPNMAKCVEAQVGKWRRCGCHRPDNVWASRYVFGFVPVAAALVGFLLLRGSLPLRLVLLNVAVALAIVVEVLHSLARDPAVGMVVPFVPLLILGFCAGTSVFFAIMHFSREFLVRRVMRRGR